MRIRIAAALSVALLLQACGSHEVSGEYKAGGRVLRALPGMILASWRKPDPAVVAQMRAALQADGKPVISVALPDLAYSGLMVPYYPSRAGQVWSSVTYETVTLRDGVLVESRGLGPDIMASQAPQAAQIAAASGGFHRIYEYLDGSDSAVRFDYDCDFAPAGAEKVTVLDQVYDTRKVVETCFKGAERFENVYWFDGGGKIRQSDQLLVPGSAAMRLQRIID